MAAKHDLFFHTAPRNSMVEQDTKPTLEHLVTILTAVDGQSLDSFLVRQMFRVGYARTLRQLLQNWWDGALEEEKQDLWAHAYQNVITTMRNLLSDTSRKSRRQDLLAYVGRFVDASDICNDLLLMRHSSWSEHDQLIYLMKWLVASFPSFEHQLLESLDCHWKDLPFQAQQDMAQAVLNHAELCAMTKNSSRSHVIHAVLNQLPWRKRMLPTTRNRAKEILQQH